MFLSSARVNTFLILVVSCFSFRIQHQVLIANKRKRGKNIISHCYSCEQGNSFLTTLILNSPPATCIVSPAMPAQIYRKILNVLFIQICFVFRFNYYFSKFICTGTRFKHAPAEDLCGSGVSGERITYGEKVLTVAGTNEESI